MEAVKNVFFFLFFLMSLLVLGQKVDSLSGKTNHYLVSKIDSLAFEKGSDLVQVYVKAYIKNNKQKKNYKSLFYAYNVAAFHFPNFAEEYTDSALWIAQSTNDKNLIGKALYESAGLDYDRRHYKNALSTYLKADSILKDTQNEFLRNKVKYSIGVIRLYLGHYNEAIENFKNTKSYFETVDDLNHQRMLMRSVYRLGEAYQQTDQFNNAATINLFGLQKAIEQGEIYQTNYFNLSIGIDRYFAGDYALALNHIEKSVPVLKDLMDFDVVQKAHFYLGLIYLKYGDEEKAFKNFIEIDRLFIENGFLNPQAREGYEWVINYYRRSDNKEKQLYYVNQLLKADQINATNVQGLAYTLNTKYDTRQLEEEKNRLERRFNNWNLIGVGVLILLLSFILFFFIKLRKISKEKELLQKRFNILMNQPEPEQKIVFSKERTVEISKKQEVPVEVVEIIIQRLQKFEDEQEFLNPNVSLNYLAKKFKTNRSYLSKVINEHKGVNFTFYLYNLRIDYIVNLLKNKPEYRHYTIKSLATQSGFSGYRQFSNAFYVRTQLRPSFFLEQIKKDDKTQM